MKYARKYLDKKYLFPLFAGFVAFLLVKTFFIDLVMVSSPSMQPALEPGKSVFICKIFTPKHGDMVEVALPLSDKEVGQEKVGVFKRIVALPGDTVTIRNSRLFLNGRLLPDNEKFLHNYIAKLEKQADTVVFAKVNISEKYLVDDSCVYLVMLTDQQFRELQVEKQLYTLLPNNEDSALYDEAVFPNDPQIKWNKDFFGPLYIPKKGDELKLDASNVKLYEHLITVFEGNPLEIEKGKIYINEKEVHSYTVKQDYYFVTGDNFDNSIDSRHWGFVPAGSIKARTLRKK